MRAILLGALALLPATSAAAPAEPQVVRPPAVEALGQSADCPQTIRHDAWDRSKPMTPRKLTELPEANAYAAVYRVIDGCEEPVMVRFDLGGR